jgi:hypothetical protein
MNSDLSSKSSSKNIDFWLRGPWSHGDDAGHNDGCKQNTKFAQILSLIV